VNMNPEEAITAAESLAGSMTGIPVPERVALFSAAMLLIMQDIMDGDCTCDPCARTRATLAGFVGQP
jgi:hypothetical protein